MYISKIDFSEHAERDKILDKLNSKKVEVLKRYIKNNGSNLLELSDMKIECWVLDKDREPNDLRDILSDRVNIIMEEMSNTDNDLVLLSEKLFFTGLMISQRTLNPIIPEDKKEAYMRILDIKSVSLKERITKEVDIQKLIELKIELFYLNEEIKAMGKITITKEKSDKIIDDKIKSYKSIIELLKRKLELQKKSILEIKNELLLVNTEIEIANLEIEITAKQEFLKHYEERKNVTGQY
jgi:hypothetical protein